MATQLQDLQAKRKELQATNPNATMLDAKSALSPTPIANAPVAGVAPAITLTTPTAPVAPSVHSGGMSPTEQANRDILAKNQTTAPVAPTVTPEVTTPTTPTVTPTETPTVAPTVAPEPTVQVASQAVQAPTPTQAVKSPTQATNKAILEQNKLKPPSTRDIALSNKLGQYSAMTSQQFVDLMKQGQIPSTVSSQLVANPQFQQAQQEYSQFLKTNNINNSGRAVYNAMTGGQPEQAVNPLVEISNNLLKAFGVDGTQGSYLDAFKESISQNEAVRTKTLELNAKNAQIDEKVQARDNILKDLKATHQGVPLSTLVAMASRDAQPINDEITTLQRDVKQLSSDLQFETELAKSEYDAKTKDMEAKTNIRNTILGNLMNAQFGLATKQMEAQMADQIAKQAFNDPLKATQGILEQYTKMGVIPSKVAQVYAEEAQDYVDRGGKLSDYLNTMIGEFQASEGFKQYAEMKAGELSDIQKMKLQAQLGEASNVADFNRQIQLAGLKGDIDRQNYLWQIENDPEKQAKALEIQEKLNNNKSLFDVLGTNVGTYEGNRGYDLAGTKGTPVVSGNGWKVIETDTAGEQVGSIFKSGKGAKPYGNTVLMEDENGNKIRYSHLDSIGVKKDDVLGFGDIIGAMGNTGNVLGKNGEKLTAEQLAQGRGSHVDVEIKDPSGKLLTNAEQVNYLKNQKKGTTDITDKQFTQYNQMYSKFTADPNVKAFESALAGGGDLIASLKSSNGPGDVGAVFGFMKSLDPQSVVKEGEFALAAKSAGVWEQFKNIPANKLEGTILTEDQRKAFGKLAFEYIKNKGKIYDIKYNDLTKVLNNQGIPKNYYPTKMTEMINMYDDQKGGGTDNVDSIMAEYNARK